MKRHQSTTRGFRQAAHLLRDRIRQAGESRGFAVSRVLTHWAEVVGPDIAARARPVDIRYGREGFGATLTLLTTGPEAPMLDMQRERIREKVNAAYGYNAISRIRITQTAPAGFAEAQAAFSPVPPKNRPEEVAPPPEVVETVSRTTAPIADDGLREALERLGRNVLSKPKR